MYAECCMGEPKANGSYICYIDILGLLYMHIYVYIVSLFNLHPRYIGLNPMMDCIVHALSCACFPENNKHPNVPAKTCSYFFHDKRPIYRQIPWNFFGKRSNHHHDCLVYIEINLSLYSKLGCD